MILPCLSCQTRFLVPASEFAAGARMVKCTLCGHSWVAELPAEPAAHLAQQISSLGAAQGEAAQPSAIAPDAPVINLSSMFKEKKSFWPQDWKVAAAIMTVAAVLLLLILDRHWIARRFPAAEPVYDKVGLHIYHPGEGLTLRQVRSEIQFEGGMRMLTVAGMVHNDTDKPQPIPNILAAALGPDDKVMQSWQIDAPAAMVGPGDDVPLNSEIRAPEGTVVDINLHFIEPGS